MQKTKPLFILSWHLGSEPPCSPGELDRASVIWTPPEVWVKRQPSRLSGPFCLIPHPNPAFQDLASVGKSNSKKITSIKTQGFFLQPKEVRRAGLLPCKPPQGWGQEQGEVSQCSWPAMDSTFGGTRERGEGTGSCCLPTGTCGLQSEALHNPHGLSRSPKQIRTSTGVSMFADLGERETQDGTSTC